MELFGNSPNALLVLFLSFLPHLNSTHGFITVSAESNLK